MPVFYGGVFISAPDSGFLENDSDASSDNPARADRLMQLINNIGVIQTDIAKENQRMDTLEEECRTKLDQLLKDRKIDTLQELEDKAMGKLTTEEKEEFNQLIKATKTVAQVSDTMMWAGLLLSSDKMVKLGGKAVMALVRGIASIQAVRVAVTAFLEAIGSITKGGASAGRALATVAKKAGDIVDAAKKVTGLANAESRVARVFKFLGKIGNWLSWAGVVLVATAPLIDIIVGGQQKEALIEGIHETQVTRLVVNSLKQQARNITEQMSTMNMFLLILKSGDEVSAGKMANIMIGSIQEEDDKISLADLEDSLRVADKSTLKFYGADDLDKDTVVQRAQIDRDEDTTHFKIEKA